MLVADCVLLPRCYVSFAIARLPLGRLLLPLILHSCWQSRSGHAPVNELEAPCESAAQDVRCPSQHLSLWLRFHGADPAGAASRPEVPESICCCAAQLHVSDLPFPTRGFAEVLALIFLRHTQTRILPGFPAVVSGYKTSDRSTSLPHPQLQSRPANQPFCHVPAAIPIWIA